MLTFLNRAQTSLAEVDCCNMTGPFPSVCGLVYSVNVRGNQGRVGPAGLCIPLCN